tara:strand:+ start:1286 stop:1495 length:210 start_codon:yes stop_codon:yes gene_type:complete
MVERMYAPTISASVQLTKEKQNVMMINLYVLKKAAVKVGEVVGCSGLSLGMRRISDMVLVDDIYGCAAV